MSRNRRLVLGLNPPVSFLVGLAIGMHNHYSWAWNVGYGLLLAATSTGTALWMGRALSTDSEHRQR